MTQMGTGVRVVNNTPLFAGAFSFKRSQLTGEGSFKQLTCTLKALLIFNLLVSVISVFADIVSHLKIDAN